MVKIILMCILSQALQYEAFAFDALEPNIQCTIIKVQHKSQALGFKKFPELYQSINNDSVKSLLFIAGKEFPMANPVSVLKTESYEKIVIQLENDNVELELKGKPSSRNGYLKVNGKIVADITCH